MFATTVFVCLLLAVLGQELPSRVCPKATTIPSRRRRAGETRIQVTDPRTGKRFQAKETMTLAEVYSGSSQGIRVGDYFTERECRGAQSLGEIKWLDNTSDSTAVFPGRSFLDGILNERTTSPLMVGGDGRATIGSSVGNILTFRGRNLQTNSSLETILVGGKEHGQWLGVVTSLLKTWTTISVKGMTELGDQVMGECPGVSMLIWSGLAQITHEGSREVKGIPNPTARTPRLWGPAILVGKFMVTSAVGAGNGSIISENYVCFQGIRTTPLHLTHHVSSDREFTSTSTPGFASFDGVSCTRAGYAASVVLTGDAPIGCFRSGSMVSYDTCTVEIDATREIQSMCDADEWCTIRKNLRGCGHAVSLPPGYRENKGRQCTCLGPVPHVDTGPTYIRGDPGMMSGFCSQMVTDGESETRVAGPEFLEVEESRALRRRKRGAFCLLLCVGIGEIGDTIDAFKSDFEDFKNTANRNFDRVTADLNRVITFANAEAARLSQIERNLLDLQTRVNSLRSYVDQFIDYQEQVNVRTYRYIRAVETQAMVNAHNVRVLQRFLERGGDVIRDLYNDTYIQDQEGCYIRAIGAGEGFQRPILNWTDFLPQIQQELLKPASSLEVLPDVVVEGTSLGIGAVVVVIVVLVCILLLCCCVYRLKGKTFKLQGNGFGSQVERDRGSRQNETPGNQEPRGRRQTEGGLPMTGWRVTTGSYNGQPVSNMF